MMLQLNGVDIAQVDAEVAEYLIRLAREAGPGLQIKVAVIQPNEGNAEIRDRFNQPNIVHKVVSIEVEMAFKFYFKETRG